MVMSEQEAPHDRIERAEKAKRVVRLVWVV